MLTKLLQPTLTEEKANELAPQKPAIQTSGLNQVLDAPKKLTWLGVSSVSEDHPFGRWEYM
jgi:hypothetical protein